MSDIQTDKEVFYNAFEPKTTNRFVAQFKDSSGSFLPTFVINHISRPKCEMYTNETGQRVVKWLPLHVILYDPIVPSASQAVWTHIHKAEPFEITIDVFGPVGDVVEKWKINNAFVKTLDFGELDWSSHSDTKQTIHSQNTTRYYNGSGCLYIHMSVEYEYAELIY